MDAIRPTIKEEFKKRVYTFVLNVIKALENLPNDNISRRIGDQLLRSSSSIIGNYVEAYAASSRRDFTNFMNHSLKSANETILWIALLRDTKHISVKSSESLIRESKEIANIFGASVSTLRKKRK